jgi:hypothetical protein
MKHAEVSLSSIALASVTCLALGCSGIDGLPEQPLQPVDSGAITVDAATPADSAFVMDAGALVDVVEVADASAVATVDATTTVDATADATVDAGPCVPEDDVAFCTRLGKNCGLVNATDNCGARRTVASCGVCTSYYDSCGGGSVPNVCGCTPESDWAFCTRLARSCGQATGMDNCGVSRAVGSCGGACPPDAGPVDAGPSDAGVADASTVQRWTFTNCGASGAAGPTQAQCNTAYAGTNLAGTVTVDAGFQTWRVPSTGRYRIEAFGAGAFGRGAWISSVFSLADSESLSVVVGHAGSASESGPGGGGSFVFREKEVLIAAGGAGGGGGDKFREYPTACGPCMPDGIASSASAAPGCAGDYVSGGRLVCQWARSPRPNWALDACDADGGIRACLSTMPGFSGTAYASFGRGTVGSAPIPSGDPQLRIGGSGGGGGGFQFGGPGNGGAHGGGGSSFSAGSNTLHFGGIRVGNGLLTIERLP